MQSALVNDPGQASLTCAHRIAHHLTHATKTGVSAKDRREVLLGLQVHAIHPHATLTQRLPGQRKAETICIDTSRIESGPEWRHAFMRPTRGASGKDGCWRPRLFDRLHPSPSTRGARGRQGLRTRGRVRGLGRSAWLRFNPAR